MAAVAKELDAISAVSGASTVSFALEYARPTRLEHIQLVMEARCWKSLHERAVSRLQQLQDSTKRFVAPLRGHAEHLEAALLAPHAPRPSAWTRRNARRVVSSCTNSPAPETARCWRSKSRPTAA